ncbi:unnamed protein product, partial [Ectocarpus sp. 12 AP-2014]
PQPLRPHTVHFVPRHLPLSGNPFSPFRLTVSNKRAIHTCPLHHAEKVYIRLPSSKQRCEGTIGSLPCARCTFVLPNERLAPIIPIFIARPEKYIYQKKTQWSI